MTSSHQEPLFEMNTGDPGESRPLPAAPVDRQRSTHDPEVSDERLDYMANVLGSYSLARVYFGLPLEDQEAEDARERRHLPGSPLSFPKRGNVRDFHDGGRADEYRGGMGAPELGSEADATLRAHLPELQAKRDRVVEENIRNGFEEDVIAGEFVKTDAARSTAIARYRAHIQRHYPDMSSDDVSDLIADFAETLLPPSPLQ